MDPNITVTVEIYMDGDQRMMFVSHSDTGSGAKYTANTAQEIGEHIEEYIDLYCSETN